MTSNRPLELQVITDDLTGLFNRRYLNEKLNEITSVCRKTKDHFALVMLDMDHFKEVNDNYGHDEGDKALIWISEILRNSIRSEDIIIRFAGDEFFLILPGAGIKEAHLVSERIYRNIRSNPFRGSRGQVSVEVGISGGIAIFPDDAGSVEEIFKAADNGLYLAKEEGRGKICLSSDAKSKKQHKIDRQILLNPPFTGRKAEHKQLNEIWNSVCETRKSRIVLISGDTGIGKTRLLSEFLASSGQKESVLFQAICHHYDLEIPYQPLMDMLEEGFKFHREFMTENLKKIPPREKKEFLKLLPDLEEQNAEQEPIENDPSRLYFGTAGFFKSMASEKPLILAIDDLQDIDHASLDLLSHILLQTVDYPVLTLLVIQSSVKDKYKKPEIATLFRKLGRESNVAEIPVSPLQPNDFRDMIRKIFNPEKVDDLVLIENKLCAESEGNPLFFRELLLKVVDEKMLTPGPKGWIIDENKTLTTPDRVKDLVSEHISALNEDQRALLQKASVCGKGREFFFDVFKGVSETNEGHLLDLLDFALSQGLLEEVPNARIETYRFASIQIQKGLYEQMSQLRKRKIHQKVLEILEENFQDKKGDYVEDLFFHGLSARNFPKAFLYGIQCASKAVSSHGFQEAPRYFEEAFRAFAELEADKKEFYFNPYVESSLTYGEILIYLGRYEEAFKIFSGLPESARQKNWLGFIQFKKGNFREALNLYEKGFQLTHDLMLKSLIKSRMCEVLFLQGEFQNALEWAQEAHGLAKEAQSLSMEALALKNLGNYHYYQGHTAEALSFYKRSLLCFKSIGDFRGMATTLSNIGLCHYWDKNYKVALKIFMKARKICDEIGFQPLHIQILNNIGSLYFNDRQFRLAEEYFSKCLVAAEDKGDVSVQTAAYLNLGSIFENSDRGKCEEYFLKGYELSKNTGERNQRARFERLLGDLSRTSEDYAKAEEWYLKAIETRRRLGIPEDELEPRIQILELYEKTGNKEKISQHLAETEKITADFQEPYGEKQKHLIKEIRELRLRLARENLIG